jgi:bacillithiol system protein YtxJ
MSELTHVSDLDELEAAIAESSERPVLLFKHSRTCGVSCEALDELQAHLDDAEPAAAYKLITVQSHRRVSDAAAARLGIRHETPQAILLRDGRAVWTASHFRITKRQLDQVVEG